MVYHVRAFSSDPHQPPTIPRHVALWRLTWTIGTLLIVQTIVLALSLVPSALLCWGVVHIAGSPLATFGLLTLAAGPCYVLFAMTLLVVSPLATRVLGWRTPPDVEMCIRDLPWPLLRWTRYMAAIHVVRILAGLALRGTPIWSAYLRLCGARIGRRVYVNSLGLSDYNLLELGDDVVVGADAHIAGHTVERGLVMTARVQLGPGVTVGVGSIIDIDVRVGAGCQIGALSFVPKHATLEAGAVYAGIPVRRIDTADAGLTPADSDLSRRELERSSR